jgi:CHAT domain-containing protein
MNLPAPLQAGARSLLVSLWKVDDQATALLMERFYENWLRRGHDSSEVPVSKVKALREAKRWLRSYENEAGERPFAHPYYWSAFVLLGDPQ